MEQLYDVFCNPRLAVGAVVAYFGYRTAATPPPNRLPPALTDVYGLAKRCVEEGERRAAMSEMAQRGSQVAHPKSKLWRWPRIVSFD